MSDRATITGIRVYPDQESSEQIERTEGFLGQRTGSEALVASGIGSWTLPEVSVPWWSTDTDTDTLQFAVLPSTTVAVSSPVVDTPTSQLTPDSTAPSGWLPIWVTVLAASGWLVALMLAFFLRRPRATDHRNAGNDINEDTLRPLFAALRRYARSTTSMDHTALWAKYPHSQSSPRPVAL
mmetsp:Transcript_21950/g.36759  ORF Transcript_21950/g.36759 Transcript_21950/m.36759 type:complete len:181 (+) Transcript_21950:418-960(+)